MHLSDFLWASGVFLWGVVALAIVGVLTGHIYLEHDDADKT